jgi:polysaccharide export outer membrane protein
MLNSIASEQRLTIACICLTIVLGGWVTPVAPSQTPLATTIVDADANRTSLERVPGQPLGSTGFRPELYRLGPGDEITILARDSEELSTKPYRLGQDGSVRLPLLGTVELAGFTTEQAEKEILTAMEPYFVDPSITVTISDFRSQPVSVLGAVRNPGVIQLRGPTTIVEAISMAGGLSHDAGYTAKLSRRLSEGEIDLDTVELDPTGRYQVARIGLGDLLEGGNPDTNIELRPNDVLTVKKADIVYVLGEVNRAGGFVLSEREEVSVLQAVAMAEGWNQTAAPGAAVILRPAPGSERRKLEVNLRDIMMGKSEDLKMKPDDILYIPGSRSRKIAQGLLTAGVAIATSVTVWRLGRN